MKKYLWKILSQESSVEIKVRYMDISLILIRFREFSGEVIAGEDFNDPEIIFSINAASVSSLDPQVDRQIRSAIFLAAETYPLVVFKAAEGCMESAGGISELSGELFIKGQVRKLVLVVNFSRLKKNAKQPVVTFNVFGHLDLSELVRPLARRSLNEQALISATLSFRRTKRCADGTSV